MTYVPPQRYRAALAAYLIGGLALGLANSSFVSAASRLGLRPGLGTAANVNGLMPLLAAMLAVQYPRTWTAAVGGVLSAAMFHLGQALMQSSDPLRGMALAALNAPHPILVVAAVGYAIVGVIAAALVRPWRVVGLADAHLRCTQCGYLLVGQLEPRCPECGAAFDPVRLARGGSMSVVNRPITADVPPRES